MIDMKVSVKVLTAKILFAKELVGGKKSLNLESAVSSVLLRERGIKLSF